MGGIESNQVMLEHGWREKRPQSSMHDFDIAEGGEVISDRRLREYVAVGESEIA